MKKLLKANQSLELSKFSTLFKFALRFESFHQT